MLWAFFFWKFVPVMRSALEHTAKRSKLLHIFGITNLPHTVIILIIAHTLIVAHPLLLGRKMVNFWPKMAKHTASYNRPPLCRFQTLAISNLCWCRDSRLYANLVTVTIVYKSWTSFGHFKMTSYFVIPVNNIPLIRLKFTCWHKTRWYRSMIPIIDHPQCWAYHGKMMPLINAQPQQHEVSVL